MSKVDKKLDRTILSVSLIIGFIIAISLVINWNNQSKVLSIESPTNNQINQDERLLLEI